MDLAKEPVHVEARSLSPVISLAANPPTYPRNPTQQPLDSLVLYIIRVPGSRDVVLTPLKPPTKSSISAHSIQASLYYLHVARPEDDAILKSVAADHPHNPKVSQNIGGQAAAGGNIRRKPIGDHPIEEKPPLPPPHRLPLNRLVSPTEATIHRHPVSTTIETRDLPHWSDGKENMRSEGTAEVPNLFPSLVEERFVNELRYRSNPCDVPRRPVDHRERSHENRTRPVSAAQDAHAVVPPPRKFGDTTPLRANQENAITQSPVLSSTGRSPVPRHHGNGSDGKGDFETSSNVSPLQTFANTKVHITLIRRDPSYDLQWNVGELHRSEFEREIINIDILTPGYRKFLGLEKSFSMAQLASMLSPTVNNRTDEPTVTGPEPQHPSSESSSSLDNRLSTFSRTLATVSRNSSRRDRALEAMKANFMYTEPQDSKELKAGYFTFTSPWNGTCTFVASADGHSLKCKHLIPSATDSSTFDSEKSPVVTVAEIRSNLQFPLRYGRKLSNHDTLSPSSSKAQHTPLSPTFKERAKNSHIATVFNSVQQKAQRARAGSASRIGPESSSLFLNLRRHHNHIYHRRSHSDSNPNSENESSPLPSPRGSTPQTTRAESQEEILDEGRVDFSLAHEYAGGGPSGKEAKLGKLIIHDEGLKMLDLLIAACMGVWWQSYG